MHHHAADAGSRGERPVIRTSIATVSLSGTLEDKLAACAAAWFDGVEIFEQDLVASPHSPREIGRRCADLGLAIDMYQPFRDAEGTDERTFEATLRRAEHKFRLMTELGTHTLLVVSNVGTATIDDDDLATEQLHRLAERAADHGIRIAYEALAWGRFVSTYDHAWELVRRADHPALGICLDTFHILSRGSDPAGMEQIPGDKIFSVQLADAPALSMDVLSWSRHHRVFPGQGDWDLPGFTAHVLRTGYDGPLSLEIFNDVFRQADEDRTAVDARRSLTWLEERTAPLLAERPGACAVQLSSIPHVDDPEGFAFVELRAQDGSAVEPILAGLGFARQGRHRSKPVDLWTLGEAALVVDHERGYVGEPHVTALGLVVDDPVMAASRALQLGTHLVPRRTNAGEQALQGVEAPDGTQVYFCAPSGDEEGWRAEFGAGRRLPDGAPGATVDHVNLTQPWRSFDESVLFLASALSLDPTPSVEVSSPQGLVRSQVMRTTDGAVRLALNVAPPVTLVEHDRLRQAQHVGLRVDDLVAFARAARDRGLTFLPIPANYYDDLDARFDLDPALLASLRELGLLYDRDEDGEILHFYTATVGSVFFEVVERRQAYDGFAAPNAPIRLAAQHLAERAEEPEGARRFAVAPRQVAGARRGTA